MAYLILYHILLTGDRELVRLLELELLDDSDLRLGFLFDSFGDERLFGDALRDLDLRLTFVDLFNQIQFEHATYKQ